MKKKKEFKKKLQDFIKDESGNISRDKVLKIGLGTISALGVMAAISSATGADVDQQTHENSVVQLAQRCAHSSHVSHGSHSSY